MIYGQKSGSGSPSVGSQYISILKSLNEASDATEPKALTAKDLRAKTYNKTADQSIVVRLGGLDWIVTYISKDTSGNLVATLWLSNNHQDAWSGKNENLGDYYGFSKGGLYSDWTADWMDAFGSRRTYPSNMYGTSYIRTETLNNPSNRTYATNISTLVDGTAQSTTHPFALYTVSDFGLTNYITTPDQMKWMVNRQNPSYSSSNYWRSNESLTSGNAYNYSASGGWDDSNAGAYFNYESNTYYANWGKDYLWLPSVVETGFSDTKGGLWETNTAERTTYDGSTTSFSSSTLGNSQVNYADTAYVFSWTRSANTCTSTYQYHLSPTGSGPADCGLVYESQAVRPALLLNLTKVFQTASQAHVGEILKDPTTATSTEPFNTNVTKLVNMITGEKGSAINQIASLKTQLTESATATSTNAISAADMRKNTCYKSAGESIIVRLGGLDWIVSYVSTDAANENVIAVLWLSNNHQEAWGWNGTGGTTVSDEIGWNKSIGKYYGFVNGGLYSDWSADWQSNTYGTYPGNMYGTSYIRTETLNNPSNRTYATSTSATTSAASQIKTLSGHPFALYTVSDFGLTNYLTTPDKMKWMINRQNPDDVGSDYWVSNESLTSDNAYSYSASSGWYSTDNNYESKTGYANWGKDYLWLPSMAEAGYDDTNDGFWETSRVERTVYDGVKNTTLTASSAIGSSNSWVSTTAHACSWSRSATDRETVGSYCFDMSGVLAGYNVCYSHAVRPAFLLNLTDVVAHSEMPTATVTLNQEGGTGGTTNFTLKTGDSMPTITAPTRTGYTFGGYYSATNGSGTQYYNASGSPIVATSPFIEDITLYAKWTANTYNITVNNNGGSGTSSTTYTFSSSSQTKTISKPTRTGYTFSSWTVSCSGGSPTISDTTLTIPANCTGAITLTANWTANTYNITVNNNGGSGTSSTTYTFSSSSQTKTISKPTRANYTFTGWTVSCSGGSPTVSGTTLTIPASCTGTITLTANWKLNTFNIIVNLDGGTGVSNTTYDGSSASQTKTIASPTRTGYIFSGWTVSCSGGSPSISGTTLTIPANCTGDITLTASWTAITYTVAYNKNGGLGTMSSSSHTYDVAQALTLNKFTRTGYSFQGWAKTSTGSKIYSDGEKVTNLTDEDGATVTLYAVWSVITCIVNLNNQGATTAGSTSVTATYGKTLPSITVPKKTGYTFGGYYTSTGASGVCVYKSNGTATMSSTFTDSTTLYAAWGSSLTSYIDSVFGYTLTNPYTGRYSSSLQWLAIGGYIKSSNNGVNSSYSGFQMSFDATSYATVQITYKTSSESASYDYFEIDSSNSEASFAYQGGQMTAFTTASLPITLGANTLEFYYRKDGSVNKGDDCIYISKIKITKNIYTITLDNQSATTAGTASVSVSYGDAFPKITTPTREQFTFGGYYTETNAGGTKIYNADGTAAVSSSTFYENTTLYAYWIPYSVITVEANIAEAAGVLSENSSYPRGSTFSLFAYANKGYDFDHWLKDGQVFSNNETNRVSVQAAGDCTYTAVFVAANMKLSNYAINMECQNDESAVAYGMVSSAPTTRDGEEYVAVSAAANDGYRFVAWKIGGVVSTTYTNADSLMKLSEVKGYAITAVFASDASTTALSSEARSGASVPFADDPSASATTNYSITINANISAAIGTLTGGGSYAENSTAVLGAYPVKGYELSHWLRDGEIFSNNQTSQISVKVTAAHTFTAVFVETGRAVGNTAIMAVCIDDETAQAASIATSSIVKDELTYITVTTTPMVGYRFVGWRIEDAETVDYIRDTEAFLLSDVQNMVIIAVFEKLDSTSRNPDIDN